MLPQVAIRIDDSPLIAHGKFSSDLRIEVFQSQYRVELMIGQFSKLNLYRNLKMHCLRYATILCVAILGYLSLANDVSAVQTDTPNRDNRISFGQVIRPILSKHCFACHGPDDNKREAGLRLDIANEDVDFESVLERIQAHDESEVMPPPSTNKPLDKKKIGFLKEWIQQGAQYEKHWAFVSPVKTPVPSNQNPIDFFIDRKLALVGSSRSKSADPAKLIRRVYLDLTGLPPTLEQATAFIDDPSLAAYEKVVDNLLASPRYGERWARRWLDLARYADTNGFEKDRDRSIWPYRDWVIRSINQGMPFDQFTIEQLAGDMLPNPTPKQIVATGFHRNTMLNEEGGVDPLEYRYYALVDRVGTTGTTWLGLTTACAQCHTHKFDPITHQDYFGLMAYMDNVNEPDFFLPVEDAASKREQNLQQANKLLVELPNHWPTKSDDYQGPTFDEAFSSWVQDQRQAIADWKILIPQELSSNSPDLTTEENGVIFASGDITKHDTFELAFAAQPDMITAIRLEVLPDKRLPGFGPGMAYYEGPKGDFFLAEIVIHVGDQPLKWGQATETFANNAFGSQSVSASHATDGDFQSGWSTARRSGERHVSVFNLKEPVPAGTAFKIKMDFGRHFASTLGKFRISAALSKTPVLATKLSATELASVVQESATESTELMQSFGLQAKQLEKYAARIRLLRKPIVGTPTMVMQERSADRRRPTYLRHRGEYTQPKEIVGPRLPDALISQREFAMPENRLELARWLVSRENPLTARVVANRQWAAFFGTGLVATVDDFGMQGELPSHPELLDYLAVELMDLDWSIKQLHRLIVTSQTYRQDSAIGDLASGTGEADRISVRLLNRFPRRRLEAEVIRDTSLFSAGLLSEKMYGKPVRPPQPSGVAANFSESRWTASSGEDRYRRSIYTYQKRTAPFAMFTTFDAGSGESCIARRDVSNTPLQALTLMNDPMFVEISQAFGKRIESSAGGTKEKLVQAFQMLLVRRPEPDEIAMLQAFHRKHQDWTAVARALLCLDEAISNN